MKTLLEFLVNNHITEFLVNKPITSSTKGYKYIELPDNIYDFPNVLSKSLNVNDFIHVEWKNANSDNTYECIGILKDTKFKVLFKACVLHCKITIDADNKVTANGVIGVGVDSKLRLCTSQEIEKIKDEAKKLNITL